MYFVLLFAFIISKSLTCAEQQQDLHAQVLIMGNLQPDELAGNLQHLLKLLGHVGQLHPLPDEFKHKRVKTHKSHS